MHEKTITVSDWDLMEKRVAELERQVKNLHSHLGVDPAPAPFCAEREGWYRMRCGGVVECLWLGGFSAYPLRLCDNEDITWSKGGYCFDDKNPTQIDLIEYLGTEKPE